MRDIVVPGALILVVGLLAGVVYYGFRPTVGGLRPAEQETAMQAAAAQAAEKGAKDASRERRSAGRSASARAAAAAVSDLPEPALDIPAAPIPSAERLVPPFPSDRDLPRGMPRSRLRALYGSPSLRVSATRDGRLIERYVYLKPDRTSATVAYLENGAVIASETLVQ